MHAEAYVAAGLCMHCRPVVQGNSVVGMQCMQRAIHCRPMVKVL